MEKLKAFLAKNHAAISNFSNSWMTEFLAKRSMDEIEPGAIDLISTGVNIGIAIAVRQQVSLQPGAAHEQSNPTALC